jgi:phosphotriesterase-related protein
MATVETVLGPIEASALGFTLSHEHVVVSSGEDVQHYPWLYDLEATEAQAVAELSEAKAGGVDTIIDLTTPDLGRDVERVARIAEASGMNVVVATGIWRDVPRSFWARDIDTIADIFVREIEEGIGDTSIKAGAIKVANDAEGVTEHGELILRGAARAAKRTGAPVSTHHWAPLEVGRRQVELFVEEEVPMHLVCIGHSADTTDADYLEELLRTGIYMSMDRYPGGPGRVGWEDRNATVKELIDRGWGERLMLGHDYAPQPVRAGAEVQSSNNPTRYLFVSTVAIPALLESGVEQSMIDTMMRDVPRRFLTGET